MSSIGDVPREESGGASTGRVSVFDRLSGLSAPIRRARRHRDEAQEGVQEGTKLDHEESGDGELPMKRARHTQPLKLPSRTEARRGDLRDVLGTRSQVQPYSFDAENNVVVTADAVPSAFVVPDPRVEYKRARVVCKLNRSFVQLCQDELNITPPRIVFYRWIMEMATCAGTGSDPVLRDVHSAVESEALRRELRAEIPCRVRAYSFTKYNMGVRTLREYVRKARVWLTMLAASEEQAQRDAQEAEQQQQQQQQQEAPKAVESKSGAEEEEEEEGEGKATASAASGEMDTDTDADTAEQAGSGSVAAQVEAHLSTVERQLAMGFRGNRAHVNRLLTALRDECTPLFAAFVANKVERVCERLLELAQSAVEEVAAFSQQQQQQQQHVSSADVGTAGGAQEQSGAGDDTKAPGAGEAEEDAAAGKHSSHAGRNHKESGHKSSAGHDHDDRDGDDDDEDEDEEENGVRAAIRRKMRGGMDTGPEASAGGNTSASPNQPSAGGKRAVGAMLPPGPDDEMWSTEQLQSCGVEVVVDDASSKGDASHDSDTPVTVRFANDAIALTRQAYTRLHTLFTLHQERHQLPAGTFNACLYCVLRRYLTVMGGLPQTPGASFEAPVPPSVMQTLHEGFGVCLQLCASPMNTHFRFFCSAYPDTDAVFGSLGSFCDFMASEGSLQCHPPCTEEAIERTAGHVEHMLSQAAGPLTVVFVSPNWMHPPCTGLELLSKSPYNRLEFMAPRSAHAYVSGVDYLAATTTRNVRNVTPMFDSRVFVLQNDAANDMRPPEGDRLLYLKRALGAA